MRAITQESLTAIARWVVEPRVNGFQTQARLAVDPNHGPCIQILLHRLGKVAIIGFTFESLCTAAEKGEDPALVVIRTVDDVCEKAPPDNENKEIRQ